MIDTAEIQALSEPEVDGPVFMIYGLLGRNRYQVEPVHATDEAAARAWYHRKYPGWEGTIFKVEELVMEDEPDV